MTETDQISSSQYPLALSSSSSSSSLSIPPLPQYQFYIGSFVNLVSTYGLRYEGVLCHLNSQDLILGLQNVICYGTEGRNNGFQVLPSIDVHSYIFFSTTQIKEMLVTPPTSFTHYEPSPHATKPPLPLVFSSNDQNSAKIMISEEELTKPTKDYDASSVTISVNDGLQIAQTQYPELSFLNPYPWPCGEQNHHQAPTQAPSELGFAPQSFFTTFPPIPLSLRPSNKGFDFDAPTKNFKQYNLWSQPQGNKNNLGDANTIDGSFYMISRNPFDSIGRPFNHGPIEKPLTP